MKKEKVELVLHPYPAHGAPRTLEEMATGKPEGQAVGRGGPHTSLVPLPSLPPPPAPLRDSAGRWLQMCGEGIQTHSSTEQPRQPGPSGLSFHRVWTSSWVSQFYVRP